MTIGKIHIDFHKMTSLGCPCGTSWGSLGGPWGALGGPWGVLGGPLGVLGGPGGLIGIFVNPTPTMTGKSHLGTSNSNAKSNGKTNVILRIS